MELIKRWWCSFFHPWKWVVSEQKVREHLEQYERYLRREISYDQLHMQDTLVRYCVECDKLIDPSK